MVEIEVKSSLDLSAIMPDGMDPGEVKAKTTKDSHVALTIQMQKEEAEAQKNPEEEENVQLATKTQEQMELEKKQA
jgi:hypothetical protein